MQIGPYPKRLKILLSTVLSHRWRNPWLHARARSILKAEGCTDEAENDDCKGGADGTNTLRASGALHALNRLQWEMLNGARM